MKFKIAIDRTSYRFEPAVTDPLEFLNKPTTVTLLPFVNPFHAHFTGESERTKHRWLKPSTLLIGPIDDLDGSESFDSVIVQRTEYFQSRQHPQDAVEPTSRPLSIEVAADDHRLQSLTSPSSTENHSTELID
jgi:hypothetical protein